MNFCLLCFSTLNFFYKSCIESSACSSLLMHKIEIVTRFERWVLPNEVLLKNIFCLTVLSYPPSHIISSNLCFTCFQQKEDAKKKQKEKNRLKQTGVRLELSDSEDELVLPNSV